MSSTDPTFTSTLIVSDRTQATAFAQGQMIVPLVNGSSSGNLPGCQFSAGEVNMPALGYDSDGKPRGVSNAHVHYETDVAVYVVSAGPRGAITRKGHQLEEVVHQLPGELLIIPRGEPHVALNPSEDHEVIAIEFRARPDLAEDNNLRPELQHVALEAHAKLLAEQRTGADSVASHPELDVRR